MILLILSVSGLIVGFVVVAQIKVCSAQVSFLLGDTVLINDKMALGRCQILRVSKFLG